MRACAAIASVFFLTALCGRAVVAETDAHGWPIYRIEERAPPSFVFGGLPAMPEGYTPPPSISLAPEGRPKPATKILTPLAPNFTQSIEEMFPARQ